MSKESIKRLAVVLLAIILGIAALPIVAALAAKVRSLLA